MLLNFGYLEVRQDATCFMNFQVNGEQTAVPDGQLWEHGLSGAADFVSGPSTGPLYCRLACMIVVTKCLNIVEITT